MKKKITIIGGGPGGYVAAIRAARLGAEVHLAESGRFGGTCLNAGCIPTKTLLRATAFYKQMKDGAIAGVRAENVTLDWAEVQERKTSVVDSLVNGVNALLIANGVSIHRGEAAFTDSRTVSVSGKALPAADAIIIASGSVPVRLSLPGAELRQVIDSAGALALTKIPESVCVAGGGVVGVEFASVFSAAGSKVSIVEALPEILPMADRQAAVMMRGILESGGVEVMTGAKILAVEEGKSGRVIYEIEQVSGKKRVESEFVLAAVGRRANIAGLDLDIAGVRTANGAILADDNFETSAKGIFAVGDCNAAHMLAHAASAQGEAAAEYIMEGRHDYRAGAIPYCVYTSPEMAGIGLTEEDAKKRGINCATGIFDLKANGKALIDGGAGFVKIIADRESGELLGAHMIGPRVTDMIAEIAVAMSMEGLAEDVARTVHAHPTVSEAVREAALAVSGGAIHWPPKR